MKIRKLMIIGIMLVLLVSCSSKVKDPLAGGEMMFWKVSDDDSSVYLLGSMHFGKADFYPMPEVIENAYASSDLLGVEIDILNMDAEVYQASIMQNMSYTDGTNLLDHISPETTELLTAYLKDKGMSIDNFKSLKPGIITVTISGMEAQMAGLVAEYGIDNHFLIKASKDEKTIVEFESIESQIDLLFGDEEIAEGLLYSTLKESKDFKVMLDSLATIWQSGDAIAMNKILTSAETEEEARYIENLFGDRDVKMTEKIEEMLAENQNGFVILGAGHYVNEDGIINRLADTKKYEIEKF